MGTIQDALTEFGRKYPGIGLAVARIGPTGTETAYLNCSASNRFEIGSITKVFTSILLAQAVHEGKCGFDDPVKKWLPLGTRVPGFFGRPITLQDLVTHTSGLPRLPLSMMLRTGSGPQPYAKWSRKRLLKSLSSTIIFRSPGSTYAYSNFGFAILGDALERIEQTSYADLVQDLSIKLGCPGVHLPKSEEQGLAARGLPVEAWRFGAFAPAGALTATLDDLTRFANTNLDETRLAALGTAMEQRGAYSNRQPFGVGIAKALIWSVFAALLSSSGLSTLAVAFATMAAGVLGGGIAVLAWLVVCLSTGSAIWVPLGYGVFVTVLMNYTTGLTRTQAMGLGWHIAGKDGRQFYWHNGGTAGFRSYLAFCPVTKTAVVVLAAHNKSVDALGSALLTQSC